MSKLFKPFTLSAQLVRPLGFFSCWSNCLELIAWRHADLECSVDSYRQLLKKFLFLQY